VGRKWEENGGMKKYAKMLRVKKRVILLERSTR
jgi:hypothetical protein